MLALLVAYYSTAAPTRALDALADYKTRHGWTFVISGLDPRRRDLAGDFSDRVFPARPPNATGICATCSSPFRSGRSMARSSICFIAAKRLGSATSSPCRWWSAKVCRRPVRLQSIFRRALRRSHLRMEKRAASPGSRSADRLRWTHYRDKIIPTLCATWAVWIPMTAIIYSLPLALQFPLFSLALVFWVLLLTYMTNSFRHEKQSRRRARRVLCRRPVAEIAR